MVLGPLAFPIDNPSPGVSANLAGAALTTARATVG
jgi:hypothetical protein